ncbi:unnamed protein product [Mesocestoides corti]|nr:unnamed protein product [Mesocestoides corti]
MTACWSHDPDSRPEAEVIAKVTQFPPLPPPPLPPAPRPAEVRSGSKKRSPFVTAIAPLAQNSHPQQLHLPAVADTGFGQIHTVYRVDAVETVTCAISDLRGRVWIGGSGVPNSADPGGKASAAAAFLETKAPSEDRLVVVDGASRCCLACSWSPKPDPHQSIPTLPPNSALPLNLPGGHPVALAVSHEGHLWCADSVGRLLIFSTSSLSLLASVALSTLEPAMAGDCIWMQSVGEAEDAISVVLGLSTGWICCASFTEPDGIVITWALNSLAPAKKSSHHQQQQQLPTGHLYLCACRVAEGTLWLGGGPSVVSEIRQAKESGGWECQATWAVPLLPNGKQPTRVTPHNCGRICTPGPAVTALTSDFECNSATKETRAWIYSYPCNEISCWSVRTRTPLRSLKLDAEGVNLLFNPSLTIPGALPDYTSSIGFPERVIWIPRVGLFAGTSRGALVKFDWPASGSDDGNDAPIVARILRLHRGPGDPCFSLLTSAPRCASHSKGQTMLSLGRGFLHPLHQCLSASQNYTSEYTTSSYFLISLFSDEHFSDI